MRDPRRRSVVLSRPRSPCAPRLRLPGNRRLAACSVDGNLAACQHRRACGLGGHPARANSCNRGHEPGGVDIDPGVSRRARGDRPDAWTEPFLRLHPDGAGWVGNRRRQRCGSNRVIGSGAVGGQAPSSGSIATQRREVTLRLE